MRSTLTTVAKDASPQVVGSCVTYLRRYGLQAMVGIAPEDDDGNAAQGQGDPPKAQKRAYQKQGYPSEAEMQEREARQSKGGETSLRPTHNPEPRAGAAQRAMTETPVGHSPAPGTEPTILTENHKRFPHSCDDALGIGDGIQQQLFRPFALGYVPDKRKVDFPAGKLASLRRLAFAKISFH